MSLRTGLAVVGGVIGASYGNPQLGWAIGSAIGSAVDPQTIPGPKVGEIANQTAQEGGPRPVVYGMSQPIPPNVIAQGDPVIVKTKQSAGKGGPKVESEQVFRTYALGICEGPIKGVLRVWRNNVLVYDARAASDLSPDENLAFLEKARFFLGDYTQLPSSDLEPIFGIGTTPSFRGTAYMVMVDEDLTDLRGAIPQWVFQVDTESTQQLRYGFPGVVRTVFTANGTWVRPAGVDKVAVLAVGRGGSGLGGSGTGHKTAGGGGGGGEVVYRPEITVTGNVAVQMDQQGSSPDFPSLVTTRFGVSPNILVEARNGQWSGVLPNAVVAAGGGGGGSSGGGGINIVNGVVSSIGLGNGGAGSTVLSGDSWSPGYLGGGGGGAGGAGSSGESGGAGGPGVDMGAIVGRDVGDGGWFGGGGGGTVSTHAAWILHGERTPGRFGHGLGGPGGGGDGQFYSWYATGDVANGIGVLGAGGMDGSGGGGGGGAAVVGNSPFNYSSGSYVSTRPAGGRGVVIVLHYDPAYWGAGFWPTNSSVQFIVEKICARAGLPPELIDTSDLVGIEIHGLTITNQYNAIEAIRALGEVCFFDPVPVDGVLKFVRRGGNSVATLTVDDMVDEGDGVQDEDDRRDDAITVPRVLNLNYHDVAGGLATDKQTSERSGDRRAVGNKSLQSPVVLNANAAARAVAITHKVLAENQKGTVRLVLPDTWIRLIPTDPVIAPVGGVNKRLMIQKAEILDGYQRYECSYDRQSAYTSDIEGIPAAPQTPPPGSIVGPTLLAVLDIPLITDSDDVAGHGYYVAVSGTTNAWTGCLVERSRDGGASYPEQETVTYSAVMGALVTGLGDHPQEWPDDTHAVQVQILTPDGELEDATLEAMMNRTNLAAIGNPTDGWELVCFGSAEEISQGVWELSHFLRGRKATATRAHVAGEQFVLLDRELVPFIAADASDYQQELTFRATSIGLPSATATVQTILLQSKVQVERAVDHLEAEQVGDDLTLSWVGVGRIGGGVAGAAHGQYFTHYRVEFEGSNGARIVQTTTDTDLTQDVSSLPAPVEYSVCQYNSLTGCGGGTSTLNLTFTLVTTTEHNSMFVEPWGSTGLLLGALDLYGWLGGIDRGARYLLNRSTHSQINGLSIAPVTSPSRVRGTLTDGAVGWQLVTVDGSMPSRIYRYPALGDFGDISNPIVTGANGEDFVGLALSGDGLTLYVASVAAGQIKAYDATTMVELTNVAVSGLSGRIARYADLLFAICGTEVAVIDVGGSPLAEVDRFDVGEPMRAIVATADLVFVFCEDTVQAWSHTGTQIREHEHWNAYDTDIDGPAWLVKDDAERVVFVDMVGPSSTRQIVLLDPTDGRELARKDVAQPLKAMVGWNNDRYYAVGQKGIYITNLTYVYRATIL